MAQAIEGRPIGRAGIDTHSFSDLWRLRIVSGWLFLLLVTMGLFALSWDIQWHTAVGRDRTLTAPHLFILASITLMGLLALLVVLIETRWARRNPALARGGTSFAGFFSSSMGAYLVGYGALDTAIAFPIDQYWHTLYGIDVAIWAPFHIMVITGFCISALGVAHMLAEGANMATGQDAKWPARVGYSGVIIALAVLMGFLSILLPDALEDSSFLVLGNLALTVFPLMFGAFGMLVLIAALRALPWRAVATCVAVVYAVIGLINFPLIPPLMTWLLGIEQQALRPRAPMISALGFRWQYGLVIAAILLDLGVWIARRKGWSLKRSNLFLLGIGALGMSAAALLFPAFLSSVQEYGGVFVHIVNENGKIVPQIPPVQAGSIAQPNVVLTLALSLLLGLAGVYIGNWFGTSAGNSMRKRSEQENV
ncbi:MAG TPA: hypothetical protein VFN35_08325 [Ktedonobacteraceae bacterium]|nr:hypothetical protein [Ktedonobacteraceae bacterium]